MSAIGDNRLGIVEIDCHFIDRDPDQILIVFREFLIVKAETMFHKNVIEYIGYHPLFDINPKQNTPPRYDAIIFNGQLHKMERKP